MSVIRDPLQKKKNLDLSTCINLYLKMLKIMGQKFPSSGSVGCGEVSEVSEGMTKELKLLGLSWVQG